MKTKLLTAICACAVACPLAIGLGGCDKGQKLNVDAKGVYAMSAISSINYLEQKASVAGVKDTTTPTTVKLSDSDKQSMKNCLIMFDDLVGQKVTQKTSKVPADVAEKYKKYKLLMNISLPNPITKENSVYKMYYNETNTKTQEKVEDEETELEVSSTLDGVIVFGETEYTIKGEREFKKEGNESEATIEFTTTINNQSVTVSQSVEQNEVEYEYTFGDGKSEKSIEIELSNEDKAMELELELKDEANEKANKCFTITKKTENEKEFINIEYKNTNIKVTKTADKYEFTYPDNTKDSIAI